jgi:hypothetical protein
MAENADHDVAFGRFRDLRLKTVNRAIELCLPADGLEPRRRRKFTVQPLDNTVDATTFLNGVVRRRDKDADASYPILLIFDGRGIGSRGQNSKVQWRG